MFSNGTTATAHTSPLELVSSALEIAIDLDYASGNGLAETVTRVSDVVDRLRLSSRNWSRKRTAEACTGPTATPR